MPNIFSLPKPILSPTVADLFRGCEPGLLALAGKFSVNEKKILLGGGSEREERLK